VKIIDAEWSARTVNILLVKCDCGHQFKHRSDRWHVFCPKCKARDKLDVLRAKYFREEQHEG